MAKIKQALEEDGYFFAKGLLCSSESLQAYKQAFIKLVDEIAQYYLKKTAYRLEKKLEDYLFFERFSIAMGLSSGVMFDHLSPALTIQFDDFVWQSNLPSAQSVEMFELIRDSSILDLLEEVIGPEISSSSLYHINIKLSKQELNLMHQIAEDINKPFIRGWRYQFRLEKTPWHRDVTSGLRDSLSSQIYTVWIPLTEATEDNGCLQFLPESHKLESDTFELTPDLEKKLVNLPAQVGDVLVFDNKTHHCSLPNRTENECRWALNLRYLPTGQTSGRPFLPGFIARSQMPERELSSGEQWSRMWRQAFKYHDIHGVPLSLYRIQEMSRKEAQVFTGYWHKLTPDHESWLNLV